MGDSPMKMSRIKNRLSSFWSLQIIAWAIYGVMIYITFLTVVPASGMFRLLQVKFTRTIVGFLLTCLLYPIYKRLIHGYSFRFIALAVLSCCVLFGLIWPIGESAGLFLLNPKVFGFDISMAGYPKQALDYTMTLLGWSAFYFGIKYWKAWQIERERTLEAQSLAHQAQLEMLRYQLNPHFLFNALNSIRASIDEDSLRAKRMITEFSEFLRYSLLNGNSSSIPLREEIEALRNYLAIEKIRFEDKLDVAFDVEASAEEYRLPGFLIHPLVENAIKHGIGKQVSGGVVKVISDFRNNYHELVVQNSGYLNGHINGDGFGLFSTKNRLQLLFGEKANFEIRQIDNGLVEARILIPVELKKGVYDQSHYY